MTTPDQTADNQAAVLAELKRLLDPLYPVVAHIEGEPEGWDQMEMGRHSQHVELRHLARVRKALDLPWRVA